MGEGGGVVPEAVLVPLDEAGLLSAVVGGLGAHARGLGEDTGAVVGVGTLSGVDDKELYAGEQKEEGEEGGWVSVP